MKKEINKAAGTIGAGGSGGAGGAGAGVYFGGITGWGSAAQIASGLKALGSALTIGFGGMGAGVIACIALPVVGCVAGYGAYRIYSE